MSERSLPQRLLGPLYDRWQNFRNRGQALLPETEIDEPIMEDPAISSITNFIIQKVNLHRETDQFNARVLEYEAEIERTLPSLNFPERDAWNEAQDKAVRAISVVPSIGFPALDYIGTPPKEVRSISRRRLATLAGSFEANRRHKSLMATVQEQNLPPLFEEATRFLQLSEAVGPLVIPLGPINLDQFISLPPKVEDTPDYLDFFYEALRIHTALPPKDQITTEPFVQFPEITRDLTKKAADMVIAGIVSETQRTNYSPKANPGIDRQILNLSQTVSNPFVEKRRLLSMVLQNPNSRQHQECVAALSKLSGEIPTRQYFFLYAANIVHSEKLVNFYRQIAMETPEPQFREAYQETTQTIEQIVAEFSDINRLITQDDIPAIRDTESEKAGRTELNLDMLHRQMTSIVFRRASGHDFQIDPSQIKGTGILPPEEISIKFDPLNRCKFNLEFKYASAEDDPLKLTATFNTAKRQMDWNLLNSPDEQSDQIQQFRIDYLSAVSRILYRIKTIIDAQKPVPNKAEVDAISQRPKTKRTRSDERDPVYSLRKEARQKTEPVQPLMELPVESSPGVGQIISIDDQSALDKLLEDIQPIDRPAAIKAFEDFNQLSRGNFRPISSPELIARGYDYRLKISAPGGSIRAFVQNVINEHGVQVFAPIKLKYRKDAYR